MELGFTVSAGPLSQISVHILSLETAVQLATGLWGWYKGPQSIQSLQQTLESRNAALVSSQTFFRQRYSNFRNDNGCVYGAAFDTSRNLIRLALPRASTALSDDAGIDCLRALIVGLSCFMAEGQVYSILKDLIPQHLLHFGQEDNSHRFDGASLAATLQLISTVMREEVVDKIRDRLFDLVDSQLPRVTGASRIELLACQHTEICHIAGVLRWILKPAYKFEGSCKPAYPTRSLKVWALALVLGELGFEVEASRVAIRSPHEGQGTTTALNQSNLGIPEVSLVLAPGWPTDLSACEPSSAADKSPLEEPARVVPIRAIATLAYGEFVPKITVSADHLQKAFISTFQHVQTYLRQQHWIVLATGLQAVPNVENAALEHNDDSIPEASLEEILATWTDLSDAQRGMSDAVLRGRGHPRLLLRPLIAEFSAIERRMDQEATVQIMLLAWSLAVVTLFVRQAGVEGPLGLGFVYCMPFTRMFNPPEHILHVRILEPSQSNLRHTALYRQVRWAFELLSNLATFCGVAGAPMPDSSRMHSFREDWQRMVTYSLTGPSTPGSADSMFWSKFGVQRHGLSIVSDFILNPSFKLPSMLVYHVQQGQLLDIPLNGEFIISGYPTRPRGLRLKAADVTLGSKSDIWAAPEPVDWLRWDMEPCWETDAQTCCFMYRIDGIPRFQVGIQELFAGIRALGLNYVICDGHEHHQTNEDHWEMIFNPSLDSLPSTLSEGRLRAIRGQKWLQLPIVDMVSQAQLDIAEVEKVPGSLTYVNWLVHVGENDMLAMLALISRFCRNLGPRHRIMTDCLAAGLEHATRLGYPADTVMIIVRKESSPK